VSRPQTRRERAQDVALTLASLVVAPLVGACVGVAIGAAFAATALCLVVLEPEGPHRVDAPGDDP